MSLVDLLPKTIMTSDGGATYRSLTASFIQGDRTSGDVTADFQLKVSFARIEKLQNAVLDEESISGWPS